MSYWAIVFILLAIAMAVGPIMMMQPSRRDRALAALRQSAAVAGMHVRMADYEDNSIAVYSLPVELPTPSPKWQLIKQSYGHEIHFYDQWQLAPKSDPIPSSIQASLKHYIDALPTDIVGLEVNSKMVGIWWKEQSREQGVELIKGQLERLFQIIS